VVLLDDDPRGAVNRPQLKMIATGSNTPALVRLGT
jgi:hypothetical protein